MKNLIERKSTYLISLGNRERERDELMVCGDLKFISSKLKPLFQKERF
jgi:hypothetical protein